MLRRLEKLFLIDAQVVKGAPRLAILRFGASQQVLLVAGLPKSVPTNLVNLRERLITRGTALMQSGAFLGLLETLQTEVGLRFMDRVFAQTIRRLL